MKMFLLSCLVCVSFVHTGCEDGDDSPVTTSSSFVVDRDSVKDFSAFLKELEETASQSKEGVKVSIGAQELSFFSTKYCEADFSLVHLSEDRVFLGRRAGLSNYYMMRDVR